MKKSIIATAAEVVLSKILIIDDEDIARRMFRIMLEREGHEVAEASNGNEGLERIRDFKADLVITDIVMPEKEGIETIKDLRKEFPEVKIIAISGGGRITPDAYLEVAESMGADASFEKPIRREKLVKAVEELLK